MVIYYCITILANIAAIPIFYEYINISALSIVPLFLIALMIFQALLFKTEKAENGFRTNYAGKLTDAEENGMNLSISKFLPATIPWIIPFVIFFPSVVKVLSIFVYVIGFGGGAVLYKLKNKDKITSRMQAEENERREQEKKEELGKWK
jgi:hypothetical protein